MQAHYQWIQTDPSYIKWKEQDWLGQLLSGNLKEEDLPQPLLITDWKNLEWPQTLLLQGKLAEVFKDSEIHSTVSELRIIQELADKLENHVKLFAKN